MNLKTIFQNINNRKLIAIFAGLALIYAVLRLLGLGNPDLIDILHKLLSPYLSLVETIANPVIAIFVDGVALNKHQLIFSSYLPYYEENKELIDNWISNLLYLKWMAFILIAIWLARSPIRKKLIYTALLIPIHFLAVFIGLVLLGGIGPVIINLDSLSELKPHFIGALSFFGYFVFWFKNSKDELWTSIKDLGININLPNKKIKEILWIFFILILLKNFIVPFFNFYWYIHFLLRLTQGLASLMDYNSIIDREYIIGDNNGSLFMAKWCLGLVTMFVFSSIVYLTRVNWKPTLIYISSGIILLHILNVIRLTALFIYVQHYSTEMVKDHHDIYNNIIYVIIFIMWIIWFERFYLRTKKKSKPGSTPSKT